MRGIGPKLGQTQFKVGNNSTKVGEQVKYGPTADLNDKQKQQLLQHYGKHGTEKTPQNALERLTQYSDSHTTYTNAAKKSGRPLTEQEALVSTSPKNKAPASSINHVIASGTGQNVFNHETLQFQEGVKNTQAAQQKLKTATDPAEVADAQKQLRKGLAQQAAGAGRMQGYSRATLEERHGELTPAQVTGKRNETLKNTLTAMQGPDQDKRFGAYKNVLKDTFDAPGNLRLGNRTQNTKISTGFDTPLDANGKPTKRAERLFDAHQTFGPDRLLKEDRLFTKNDKGEAMSSSKEAAVAGDKRKADALDTGTSSVKKKRKG
ncbi:hypothetical protein D7X55_02360 [Corallococcus sp. AB049A]|uniref:Uncharacterized protein n=1 Tax=Corallococcus interemptor TaxID=2316720 RepID=A0A3A8QCG5_9BACT|nr:MULTISPECIES: hypothetical protein [Corallococcus]RKH52776.1 hypothetical protein D7Y23_05695 [Corallococcus sp. AB050B]RKH65828.1 hypothetical protein D7X96_23055 [Corallococcus interemptor]RKI74421.1 hypothetical protein D7X55_02360 [Corallococcus sp. AB049A]